jgi:MoxR-like ATPase
MSLSEPMFSKILEFRTHISKSVYGQENLIEDALVALLSGGHILITGAPGLAKTTLVQAFSSFLNLEFKRIQFTPDLLPTDITGSEILNFDSKSNKKSFDFSKGPVFCNLLLADEINRASPRTQSALLEAMQEGQVTVNGSIHKLDRPFMVFATQNPFESEGTFPLPEAQLDRFILHTLVDYPDLETERKIISNPPKVPNQKALDILSKEALLELFEYIQEHVLVEESIKTAITDLARATRPGDPLFPNEYKGLVFYGAGPRAGISLLKACRAYAFIQNATHVTWNHVLRMATPVLRHRISLGLSTRNPELNTENFIKSAIIQVSKYHNYKAEGVL